MKKPVKPDREPDHFSLCLYFWWEEGILSDNRDYVCHFNPDNWTFYSKQQKTWLELYEKERDKQSYLRWLASKAIEKELLND